MSDFTAQFEGHTPGPLETGGPHTFDMGYGRGDIIKRNHPDRENIGTRLLAQTNTNFPEEAKANAILFAVAEQERDRLRAAATDLMDRVEKQSNYSFELEALAAAREARHE